MPSYGGLGLDIYNTVQIVVFLWFCVGSTWNDAIRAWTRATWSNRSISDVHVSIWPRNSVSWNINNYMYRQHTSHQCLHLKQDDNSPKETVCLISDCHRDLSSVTHSYSLFFTRVETTMSITITSGWWWWTLIIHDDAIEEEIGYGEKGTLSLFRVSISGESLRQWSMYSSNPVAIALPATLVAIRYNRLLIG